MGQNGCSGRLTKSRIATGGNGNSGYIATTQIATAESGNSAASRYITEHGESRGSSESAKPPERFATHAIRARCTWLPLRLATHMRSPRAAALTRHDIRTPRWVTTRFCLEYTTPLWLQYYAHPERGLRRRRYTWTSSCPLHGDVGARGEGDGAVLSRTPCIH